MISITENENNLMKKLIKDQCGISLQPGKEYLIETRLSNLVIENGCSSFLEFYSKAKNDSSGKIRDRVVDSMTTNETLWFRDESIWTYIREKAIPDLLRKAASGQKVRVWSGAASTGQEAYSLLILLDEQARLRGNPGLLDNIEIIGTDISSSALFLAISGRYDMITMSRGMPVSQKEKMI